MDLPVEGERGNDQTVSNNAQKRRKKERYLESRLGSVFLCPSSVTCSVMKFLFTMSTKHKLRGTKRENGSNLEHSTRQ